MSIFDKLQTLASNITAGGATGSGSTQNAGSSNATDNEVSVFSNKSNSNSNSNFLTKIDDEDFLWWQERLEEKKEEKAKTEGFDSSKYSSDEWNTVDIKEDKVLGISMGTYTYKSSSGVKITLEDTKDVKILENKKTGEIVVVGADGATINAGNKDAKITIYDSDIKKLDTDKGNDEVKIYNSNVGEITTGRGVDNVVIENSQVEKVNTGSGSDTVNIKDSSIGNANTSSSFLWGVFDDAEDTVTLVDSEADKIKTGKGDDNVIATGSDIDKLKTGKGSDSLNIDDTNVDRLRTNKDDTVIKDSNYLDVDKTKILELGKDAIIDLGDGNTISVSEYSQYLLTQPIGFETEEEYQNYVLQSLTSNLETMKNVFGTQEDKDGWVAGGYNGLKELTGLGITDKDIEEMIAKQEEMVAGLTAAMNGESDMSFEEAYEYYTGTTYSKEKIDKYMEVSNIYSAVMVGCQYDENYMEEFEAATGMSVEDVTKEYALCQLDTFGKSTGLQDLVDKYAIDQETFTDKLSSAITGLGMTCIVLGSIATFVFPPAAPFLLTAGKYISLGGMFIDNALDLVDDSTDKDGLTKEELGENALETGVEAISYLSGRMIGGFTGNINTNVTSAIIEKGGKELVAKIVGQGAETTLDFILSLGADYIITQGESYITTGEFIDLDEFFSFDRIFGEGKNQIIGILVGNASAKISDYQKSVISIAGVKISAGDLDGARADLKKAGINVNDKNFADFVRSVQEINAKNPETFKLPEEKLPSLTTGQNENTKLQEQDKNNTIPESENTKPQNQNKKGDMEPKEIDPEVIIPEEVEQTGDEPEVDVEMPEEEENTSLLEKIIESMQSKKNNVEITGDKLEQIVNYIKNELPTKKFSDEEIADVTVNEELSSNAVSLNATFEEHIGEVEQSTRNRFSGLKSVNADNITARAKSDKSTFEKIASKFKSGKLASTDIATCSDAIGDAYGTRIQMNSVDTDIAKTTITKALDGSGITYEQFVGYVTGKATFDEATTQKLSEIKAPVLDTLKTAQSQEVVDRLVHIINNADPNDPPVITELNNYGGTVSSYFTDAQLEQVATAYSKRYGKPLDIVTKLDTQNLPVGEYSVDFKDGKYISNVESSTAKYTDKGATKDSGYTSSQMNTKHKLSDGTIGNGELQIRGTEVNTFADVEHIPYDIRQGKIKPDDPKYATVYNLIKGMNDTTYESYNRYLTAVYDTLRLKELGIPVDGEPDIKTFMKNSGLSNADLDLLSRSGLEKLH